MATQRKPTAADEAAQETAVKQRIIKHMNGDHADSLALYLQHYLHLTSRAASGAKLADLSLSEMTILTRDDKAHIVRFSPPMTGWADTRTRTVDMDRECRRALGISSIRITEYEPPRSLFHIFVFCICLFTFGVFGMRNKIVPGSWFYDYVLPWFPGGPEWFVWIAKTIALPVFVLHMTEAYWLDQTRLRKYGVERGSELWWTWIISCFIEGYPSYDRIDKAVERKRLEAEQTKH